MKKPQRSLLLIISTYILYAAILFPIVFVVAISFTATPYITFPPKGVTLDWYLKVFADERILRALWVSIEVGLLSAILATILGIMGSLFLRKSRSWVVRPLTSLFLAPITVPIIVFALGSLFFFTSLGLLRSLFALVVAHAVHSFPYTIRMISSSFDRDIDQLERSGAVLGANRWQVFHKVTFPSIKAGVVAGMMFSFLLSFNNVTIALFISGAHTQTLPLVIYLRTQDRVSPDIAALATMLIIITYAMMILLEKRFGIYRMFESRQAK